MFSELSGSYEGLTEEQRLSLADLIEVRNEYTAALVTLNQMNVGLLRNYTVEGEKRTKDFSAIVIAPIRKRITVQKTNLIKKAVDIEGLKGLLPMILMGLLQNVNVTLLLTTLDLEPDMIDELVDHAKNYFKQGM